MLLQINPELHRHSMQPLYVALLALLVAGAAGQTCVPVKNCRKLLVDSEPSDNPFGSIAGFAPCKLSDGSDGVDCTQPPQDAGLASRFGPAKDGAGPGASKAAPAPNFFFPGQSTVTPIDSVQPLKNRLGGQQELVISSAVNKPQVLRQADEVLRSVEAAVNQLEASGANTAAASSTEDLQLRFGRPQSAEAESEAKKSLKAVQVLQQLKALRAVNTKPLNGLSADQPVLGSGLQNRANFPAFPLPGGDNLIPDCELPVQPVCGGPEDSVRRHNGECNNLEAKRLGRAATAFSRFFPAEYEDGIFEPRSFGVSGEPLPSARDVSRKVMRTTNNEDNWRTILVMLLGQIMNHDMISTPTFRLQVGGLACCNPDNSFPEKPPHPVACNSIRVAPDDELFRGIRTCLSHVRSLPAPFEDCKAGPTQQMNQNSHFLDLSTVYGSTDEQANRLRSFDGGLIKTSGDNLLPKERGRFFSGEGRFVENPGLTFMHLIFTREHNRLAVELKKLHSNWNDEKLYETARRINIGEFQHIIYSEFVPTILGFKYTRDHGLDPGFGHSFSYSPNVDPRVNTEFSTAAFRYGHSQIQDEFVLTDEKTGVETRMTMEESFFQTDLLEKPGFMLQMARALTKQKTRAVDNTFSPSIHERLFAGRAPVGLDLIALNINRGRDHGLPGYYTVLENCRGESLDGTWNSIKALFPRSVWNDLKRVYKSPFDIDLYAGGVAEKRVPGALVGPTFQCIIGEQFFVTRYGDRLFYDNGDLPSSMSFRQVTELQQASLARIFCDNIAGLKQIQPLALWVPHVFFNSFRSCNSFAIPTVDLEAWN